RRDDDLRSGPPRHRGIIRAADRSGGHRDVIAGIALRKRRDEVERIRGRQSHFENADAVLDVHVGHPRCVVGTILADDTDDLLAADFGHEFFTRHTRILAQTPAMLIGPLEEAWSWSTRRSMRSPSSWCTTGLVCAARPRISRRSTGIRSSKTRAR